jgi:hypothetical protein
MIFLQLCLAKILYVVDFEIFLFTFSSIALWILLTSMIPPFLPSFSNFSISFFSSSIVSKELCLPPFVLVFKALNPPFINKL